MKLISVLLFLVPYTCNSQVSEYSKRAEKIFVLASFLNIHLQETVLDLEYALADGDSTGIYWQMNVLKTDLELIDTLQLDARSLSYLIRKNTKNISSRAYVEEMTNADELDSFCNKSLSQEYEKLKIAKERFAEEVRKERK